jgi:hypothetical protein
VEFRGIPPKAGKNTTGNAGRNTSVTLKVLSFFRMQVSKILLNKAGRLAVIFCTGIFPSKCMRLKGLSHKIEMGYSLYGWIEHTYLGDELLKAVAS